MILWRYAPRNSDQTQVMESFSTEDSTYKTNQPADLSLEQGAVLLKARLPKTPFVEVISIKEGKAI